MGAPSSTPVYSPPAEPQRSGLVSEAKTAVDPARENGQRRPSCRSCRSCRLATTHDSAPCCSAIANHRRSNLHTTHRRSRLDQGRHQSRQPCTALKSHQSLQEAQPRKQCCIVRQHLPSKISQPRDERELIAQACDWHVCPDGEAGWDHPVLWLLKDVDGLDRVRLYGLDPADLRLAETRKWIERSTRLYEETIDEENPGQIWPAAAELDILVASLITYAGVQMGHKRPRAGSVRWKRRAALSRRAYLRSAGLVTVRAWC